MKFILATSLAFAARAAEVQDHETVYYEHDNSHIGNVPTGNFEEQVHDFNEWNTIWEQQEYEERVNTEAQLMVALEALREALLGLDMDIDELDYCIEHNNEDLESNDEENDWNEHEIEENEHEIDDQEYKVRRIQKKCRSWAEHFDKDRAVLVLFCQQFAFAQDMVGACASILTCADTELEYRWDPWTGQSSHGHSHYQEAMQHYEPVHEP